MAAKDWWHTDRQNHSVPAQFLLSDITRMQTSTRALKPSRQEIQNGSSKIQNTKKTTGWFLLILNGCKKSIVTYFLCLPPGGRVTVLIEWQHILNVGQSTTPTTQILVGSNVSLFPFQEHIYYQGEKEHRYYYTIVCFKNLHSGRCDPWPLTLTLRQKSINYNEDVKSRISFPWHSAAPELPAPVTSPSPNILLSALARVDVHEETPAEKKEWKTRIEITKVKSCPVFQTILDPLNTSSNC